ncbi:MAG: hypothetical protein J2O48_10300 [Solirubrobacterales bacterium]|nr:hypothetical protein [Solirubrobacterales bacterium]
MGDERAGTIAVADSGALIAVERGNRLVASTFQIAEALHIPAGVLAQVWRDPARQARLTRTVAADHTSIHALDGDTAKLVGLLCATSGTSDIADAQVVQVARQVGGIVFTSDPDDLRRIDPGVKLVVC